MPPTRRRQGNNSASNQQSTLSFGGTQSRITKPTTTTAHSTKDAKTTISNLKASSPSPAVPSSLQTTTSTPKFTTAKDLLKKTREGYTIPPASTSPTSDKETEADEAKQSTTTTTLPHHPATPSTSTKPARTLSPTESHALSLSQSDITAYWSSVESSRRAPRGTSPPFPPLPQQTLPLTSPTTVHQESTPLHEKILRHFDLSSEFGPCIGVTRMERWKRAERLGLKPRVEVLSVLLKQERERDEEGKGEGMGEMSRFDELLQ